MVCVGTGGIYWRVFVDLGGNLVGRNGDFGEEWEGTAIRPL